MNNKQSEFSKYLTTTAPDIIALQETWLKSNIHKFNTHSSPKFSTYTPIRSDRDHKRGGGVMFYVKDYIIYTEKKLQQFPNGKMETQCISVKLKTSEIDILNVYIPPDIRLYKTEFLHYINQLQRNFIICGDMNAHPIYGTQKATCQTIAQEK